MGKKQALTGIPELLQVFLKNLENKEGEIL